MLEQPLSQLTSFSEELQRRGYQPSSRWLERKIDAAQTDEQLTLGLSPVPAWCAWSACVWPTT